MVLKNISDETISTKVVNIINDYEDTLPLKHPNHMDVDSTKSLHEAIRAFVLSKAIRILRGDENKHRSMMINVSIFNSVQEEVFELVYNYVDELTKHIELNANVSFLRDKSKIIEIFKNDYQKEFLNKSDDKTEYPNWENIRTKLVNAIHSIKVKTVNMNKGGLDYSNKKYDDKGLTVIAIGGFSLSRGLTLEGLCVSYILRNASAYDSLMQMGRWFGYRKNYEDICRLYLPSQSNTYYQDVTEAMIELSEQMETMEQLNKTPLDFGLRVRENSGAIRITA